MTLHIVITPVSHQDKLLAPSCPSVRPAEILSFLVHAPGNEDGLRERAPDKNLYKISGCLVPGCPQEVAKCSDKVSLQNWTIGGLEILAALPGYQASVS